MIVILNDIGALVALVRAPRSRLVKFLPALSDALSVEDMRAL